MDSSGPSFLARHEFLIRRLHSLSGLIPVGAYMVVHLITNASVLESAATFQKNVYTIHSFGALLPVIEWVFIFLPILFHAIIGVIIIGGGLPNTTNYPYASNIRYTLQRATGMIAFVFIMWHVFHMHGWIHGDWWIDNVARRMGGAKFHPFNAASSAGVALQGMVVLAAYIIGVLSCVFHLSNGMWTMGITWGLWTSKPAQLRARKLCDGFGVFVAVVGMAAIFGMWRIGREDARQQAIATENKLFNAKIASGELDRTPAVLEKRSDDVDEVDVSER